MNLKPVSAAFQAKMYEAVVKNDKKTAPSKDPVMGKEHVELSESSLHLHKVKEAVNKAPEIRIPIVEEIKKRIANNDYPIPTHTEKALDIMLKSGIL